MDRRIKRQMAAAKRAKLLVEWAGLAPKHIRKSALTMAQENPQETAMIQEVVNTLVNAGHLASFNVRYYADKPKSRPMKSVEVSEGVEPLHNDPKPAYWRKQRNKEQ